MLDFALTAFASILFVVDPLGAVPTYLVMTQGDDSVRRRQTAWKATLAATMALAMHENVRELNTEFGTFSLRIGLQVGSVIAGVIGIRKFIYDVWGDTVNTASRLESHGAPDRTHVSETVVERLQGRFAFESRGTIELKGRGPMNTYFLDAPTP